MEERQRIFLLEQDYNTAKNKLLAKDTQIQELKEQITSLQIIVSQREVEIQNLNKIIEENNKVKQQQKERIETLESELTIITLQQEEECDEIIEMISVSLQTSFFCNKCAQLIETLNHKQEQDKKYLEQQQQQKKDTREFIENERKTFDLDQILASDREELQKYKYKLEEKLKQFQLRKERYKQAQDKVIKEKIAFTQMNLKQ